MSFCYSLNGEDFQGTFPTRDDALAEAIGYTEPKIATKVYTGVCIPCRAEDFAPSGDSLCEQMNETANDDIGEYAEDWPPNTKEQAEELGVAIKEAVRAWAEKHDLAPLFYRIGDTEEHMVPAEAEASDIGHTINAAEG